PGDIRKVAPWLRPDVAVLTGVSEIPAHVEFFDSPDHVFREKRALAEHLKPGGKLILNGDDPRMRELRTEFRGASIMYGCEPNDDFFASHYEIYYEEGRPAGVRFRINHGGSSIPATVHGALGLPRMYAATAAIAVAEAIGIDEVSAIGELKDWTPPPGRVRLIPGMKGATIIDDTYNSSPAAALAALDTLKSVNPGSGGRRIAVLGDMLELGKFAKDAHKQVGERAAQTADLLVTIGIRARTIAEAALDSGMRDQQILQFDTGLRDAAAEELARNVREGDIVLVKGSQAMRLEKVVLGLMAEPLKAAELLVRTEPEWETV
ncbi:MAG: hypothetical protein JO019_02905, partial [Candidatus Kaiserbacteria bacterium]|nr:hypothetical protein [Candidatus Kaiserbacteria bacterium]